MNMLAVIKSGADAAVAADPKPLNQSRTMAAITAAVENLPAFPLPQPYPDMDGKFHDGPCDFPKPRYGHGKTACQCGWALVDHAKRAPVTSIDER